MQIYKKHIKITRKIRTSTAKDGIVLLLKCVKELRYEMNNPVKS